MSDIVDALNKGLDPSPLFNGGEAKIGIVVFRGLKKIGGTMRKGRKNGRRNTIKTDNRIWWNFLREW